MRLLPRPAPSPAALQRRTRGVSLVEALVAMAVMSIGMLALVGVHGTMRLNSDLAKQRTEATRIASEEIERLRSFTALAPVPDTPGAYYDDIKSREVAAYEPPDGIGNTSYRIVREVRDVDGALDPGISALKIVSVQVQWTDRTGEPQSVTLDSAISATAPTLTAMLLVPPPDSPLTRRRGLHISIPDGAVPVPGDGSMSRFTPPGGGVAWYFENLSGLMRVCPGDVVDVSSCPTATLVSGTVQFHISDTAPTGAAAERPAGPLLALADAPGALELVNAVGTGTAASCYTLPVGQSARYFCAVRTSDPLGWGGQLNPVLDSGSFGNLASGYKSCRYTTDLPTADNPKTNVNEADPNAEFVANAEHPRKYCMERPRNSNEASALCTGKRVKVNLIQQNFLIIRGHQTCPTELNDDGTPNGEGRDTLILANTRPHQP